MTAVVHAIAAALAAVLALVGLVAMGPDVAPARTAVRQSANQLCATTGRIPVVTFASHGDGASIRCVASSSEVKKGG